jgi:S-adenosylmethionine:tRNA ribosyltransferase-isomerase
VAVLWLKSSAKTIHVLANKRLRIGDVLTLKKGITFTVTGEEGKAWVLRPSIPMTQLPKLLEKHGVMPLPPYIKHSPLTEAQIRKRYQTVFAKNTGSIAAPTASLHFTPALLKRIQKSGITIARVTLHVHLGTFSPLTEEQWKSGQLHHEEYSIDAKTAALINRAKKEGRRIIAAGTTVTRTLESAVDAQGKTSRGKLQIHRKPLSLAPKRRIQWNARLLQRFANRDLETD